MSLIKVVLLIQYHYKKTKNSSFLSLQSKCLEKKKRKKVKDFHLDHWISPTVELDCKNRQDRNQLGFKNQITNDQLEQIGCKDHKDKNNLTLRTKMAVPKNVFSQVRLYYELTEGRDSWGPVWKFCFDFFHFTDIFNTISKKVLVIIYFTNPVWVTKSLWCFLTCLAG